MKQISMSRRCFVGAAVSAAAHAQGARGIRLGGPIFSKTQDPAELAQEYLRLRYRAAYCPRVEISDRARLDAIRKEFAARDVVIAEAGAWKNMMDADPAKRRANLEYTTSQLAVADAVGALCCVNIAGSYHPTEWDGPDPRNFSREFFDATVENCRKVIDDARPTRAKFTIEMMPWSIPDGPDSYLRLIRAVDRTAFGVHIDICNAVTSIQRYFRNAELIEDCFRKLGRWICSCHAKDLKGSRTHLAETVPGRGGIDYRAYLRAIAKYAPAAPLMLEHLSGPAEYEEGRNYILRVGAEAGVSFYGSKEGT